MFQVKIKLTENAIYNEMVIIHKNMIFLDVRRKNFEGCSNNKMLSSFNEYIVFWNFVTIYYCPFMNSIRA